MQLRNARETYKHTDEGPLPFTPHILRFDSDKAGPTHGWCPVRKVTFSPTTLGVSQMREFESEGVLLPRVLTHEDTIPLYELLDRFHECIIYSK